MDVNGNSDEPSTSNNNDTPISESAALLVQQGFSALMPAIRVSNSLPKGEKRDLFCASPLFNPIMNALGNKALDLMTQILHHQGMFKDIKRRDLEEKTELVIDANDKILERVNTYLDDLSGIRRNPSEAKIDLPTPLVGASGSWNREVSKSAAWKEVPTAKRSDRTFIIRGGVTQRPQLKFHDKIDNSNTPFEPRIKEKPNALKPLAILYENIPNEDPCYSHPYEFELDRFQEKIELLDLTLKTPQPPKPIDETPLLMITTETQLMEMLAELRTQKEIAVDLEHHSYRSFQGFTCLMQISTREKDFLVDTLELRHKLYVLNEVFTDPKIVKVFHGADSDIPWLQRDLCLYVVNMFDTYQASLMLSLPRLSLAFLLKTICNVDANKHFQLYDWRTRPLAKEAVKYAREDTHYLLYIYEVLWNRLIEKSDGGPRLLQTVIYRSTDTCKKRYWKFIYKEDSYESMYRQSRKNFDNRQLYALRELHAWRDRTAREEDESSGFILPNHMLLLIAEQLPKEVQGILACCNPIPSLVRQNVVALHQIILKAREQPLVVRPTVNPETRVRPTQATAVNMEGPLHCPHDLTHHEDFRDDLPTLLNSSQGDEDNVDVEMVSSNDFVSATPILTIFEDLNANIDYETTKKNLPNQIHFLSPFERYKKMCQYLEDEEKSKAEKDSEREREIDQDTQNLLDECLKESMALGLLQNGTSAVEIKQENVDHNPRKRNRSQDNSQDEIAIVEVINNVQTKKEPQSNYIGGAKKKYSHVPEELNTQVMSTPTEQVKREFDSIETEVENQAKKKKKKNNSVDTKYNETQNQNQNNMSESFTQFDYSQVDYSQYQQSNTSVTPKRSTDRFKHKGKKKNQNKTFTFARQYGGSSKKK